MVAERTTPVSFRVENKKLELIDNLGINISSFLRDCINERVLNQKEIEERIKEYEKKIIELKKSLIEIKKQEVQSEEEVKFLNEAKDIIQSNPQFLTGQLSRYNNIFKKKLNITKFTDLLKLREY